jgi:hypothetical protein
MQNLADISQEASEHLHLLKEFLKRSSADKYSFSGYAVLFY